MTYMSDDVVPRTLHLPWSPGKTKDDLVLSKLDSFVGKNVVANAKMDGYTITINKEGVFSRYSRFPRYNSPEIDKLLADYHALISPLLPEGFSIYGEELYFRRSIKYSKLPHWFVAHMATDADGNWLSYQKFVELTDALNVKRAALLYSGIWNEDSLKALHTDTRDGDPCEGYVVWVAGGFSWEEYATCVGKYVRADFAQLGKIRTVGELNVIKST